MQDEAIFLRSLCGPLSTCDYGSFQGAIETKARSPAAEKLHSKKRENHHEEEEQKEETDDTPHRIQQREDQVA